MRVHGAGGNEYGQCGEEPERKEDGTRALRRDIPIPQRCALKLKVRQVSGIDSIASMRMLLNFSLSYAWFDGFSIQQISHNLVTWAWA
jgi:hypothetical protein